MCVCRPHGLRYALWDLCHFMLNSGLQATHTNVDEAPSGSNCERFCHTSVVHSTDAHMHDADFFRRAQCHIGTCTKAHTAWHTAHHCTHVYMCAEHHLHMFAVSHVHKS